MYIGPSVIAWLVSGDERVHQSVSLPEMQERRGSLYDSQNSIYEPWTPGARGSARDSENSLYTTYKQVAVKLFLSLSLSNQNIFISINVFHVNCKVQGFFI